MKGQIISMDLMVASLIVITIISGLGVLLYQYTIYETQQSELTALSLRSEPALNVLMSSSGNPSDWETRSCDEIKSFGFLSEPAVVNSSKLEAFILLDYNCVKNRLGLSGYDFYFEARDAGRNLLNINGFDITAGYKPPAGSNAIFSERKAWVDESYIATITFGVWYE